MDTPSLPEFHNPPGQVSVERDDNHCFYDRQSKRQEVTDSMINAYYINQTPTYPQIKSDSENP
jgi:hypothetical protein